MKCFFKCLNSNLFSLLGLADPFWLAGTDIGNESNFYWMGHDESMTFTNWHGGEPNNWNWNQDCVTIKYWPDNLYQWDDDFCSNEYYFICEERTITYTNLSPGTITKLLIFNLNYLTNFYSTVVSISDREAELTCPKEPNHTSRRAYNTR